MLDVTMNISLLSHNQYPLWDAYVHSHSQGTLFHLTHWKTVIEKAFGHKSYYLMAISSTQVKNQVPQSTINGILPLFQLKSVLFGNYLISVPFAEIGGVLVDDSETQNALLSEAQKLSEKLKCDYLELRNPVAINGYKTKDLYVNFKRDILPELEDNLTAIPRKARRMIRQGEKYGLSFEFGIHLLDEFYQVMSSSYKNLGTPIFPKGFFQIFLNTFRDQCQLLMVRTKEGDPAAGVLAFFFKDQVLPYYAGSEFNHRNLAPNDFMYWQLLKYGWEKGYKIFDFGRSKIDTGSYHFKRHWGFEPIPLAYQYHLVRSKELPNLSPTNPKYKKKIEMWRKLPLPITQLLGPPIAKYLG